MKDKIKSKIKAIYKDIILVVIIIVTTFVFTRTVVGLTVVIGNSMNDTYENSDLLLARKFDLNPERFDVITFKTSNGYYIKRVIGLPGETVRIDYNGNILINGEILKENYGKEVIEYQGIANNDIVLGDDEYFVLGDNRNASKDSRYEEVGPVKQSIINGIIIGGKKER